MLHSSGVEGAGRTTDRALRRHPKDTSPTKCFMESIREATHKPPNMPHQQIPELMRSDWPQLDNLGYSFHLIVFCVLETGPRAPQTLHWPRSCTPPPCGWFPMCTESDECEPLWMASEHGQKAHLPLQDWEKAIKLEPSASS